ncbi:hypothetical protein U1Q18_017532 [Sarracenia purpurea var. burkii]
MSKMRSNPFTNGRVLWRSKTGSSQKATHDANREGSSVETRVNLSPIRQRSPSKLREVFQEALIREEQMDNEDSEEADEEIEIIDLMINTVEHDISMSQQKLKNMRDTKALRG